MLEEFLADCARRVDAELDRLVPPAETAAPPARRLAQAMRYALFGGGKRLRPACVLMAAEAVGGDPDRALPAACAVELIHTYSLVHDDLPCMDDDDLRRGRATVHRRFDEATAVLAGDALLTLAFEAVAAGIAAPCAAAVARSLARGAGALGMVGGQSLDLLAEGRALDQEAVLDIDRMKTAALFRAAFECGGISVGAAHVQRERLAAVGERVGVAFQIVDDLLDLTSTPEQLGKATQKDGRKGKATLPQLLGREAAFREAERLSDEAIRLAQTLPSSRLIADLIRSMLQRSR